MLLCDSFLGKIMDKIAPAKGLGLLHFSQDIQGLAAAVGKEHFKTLMLFKEEIPL